MRPEQVPVLPGVRLALPLSSKFPFPCRPSGHGVGLTLASHPLWPFSPLSSPSAPSRPSGPAVQTQRLSANLTALAPAVPSWLLLWNRAGRVLTSFAFCFPVTPQRHLPS